MNDPLLVRRLERLRDLLRDRQRFVERDRAARNTLREIVALDEFHHEGLDAVGVLQPVDGGDMRVIQGGEHFRLALKTREPIVISRERWRQDLDGDLTLQPGVRPSIHLTHFTFANPGGHFVRAEASTGSQGQFVWIIWARLERGGD